MEGVEPREDLVVTHCTVCDCRHFEIEAEPEELGLRGASI
jgi:hypothetical protein